jgi:integrase
VSDGTVRDRFWKHHLIKAGVRYRGPNHARHTFASQLLSTGMISKDWIAQQMGHTSTKMLDDHYAKWIPEDAPPMANMINKIMGFSNQTAPQMPQKKNKTL